MKAVANLWRPPPRLTVSEWADRYRVLSSEASAEPGKWSTSRAEYQRGIMDATSDPTIEQVVVIKSAQVGWTEILNNVAGYHMHQDPSPILVVQPTVEMGETWSKDRLAPMLRDTPELRAIAAAPRSRDTASTLLRKEFPGGQMAIAGANSAASLASRPVRVLLMDEVDRYPFSAGSEGDPVSLAIKRTSNFWNRRILLGSTPTITGQSRIERAFEASDKRRYFVPCPHCDETQTLVWGQVRWTEGNPASARYHCASCGAAWTDAERWNGIRHADQLGGGWRATAPFKGIAGFHINELYSPWRRLADTVGDYEAARTAPETLKVWVNTALGETWQETGEAPDAKALHGRRGKWRTGTIPAGGLFIAGAADVQGDRIEWDVWAFGIGLSMWLIDSGVILGQPTDMATWRALTEVTERQYPDAAGRKWTIDAFGCDSGYLSQEVYRWVATHPLGGKIFALDGRGGPSLPAIGSPRKVDVDYQGRKVGAALLWPVGTHALKLSHYAAVKRAINGPDESGIYPAGTMHLPDDVDETYCRQLVSEFLAVVKVRSGHNRTEWRRIVGTRNERLDTAVYARALAHHLTEKMTPASWQRLAESRAADVPEALEGLSEHWVEKFGSDRAIVATPPRPAGRSVSGIGRRLS
jgi:phage terminase large subunit GpA-like protein